MYCVWFCAVNSYTVFFVFLCDTRSACSQRTQVVNCSVRQVPMWITIDNETHREVVPRWWDLLIMAFYNRSDLLLHWLHSLHAEDKSIISLTLILLSFTTNSALPMCYLLPLRSPPIDNIWARWLSGGRRGDYQNCSVLYCVLKLCTVISTLRWAVLTVIWIWFCLTSPISLCLDSFVFF